MAGPFVRMLSLYLPVNSHESPQLFSRPFCDLANKGLVPGVVGAFGTPLWSAIPRFLWVVSGMYQLLRGWCIIPGKDAGQPVDTVEEPVFPQTHDPRLSPPHPDVMFIKH